MISFQEALRDEFFEMSIQCNSNKKELIKKSKEFIIWAEAKIELLNEWLRKYEFENDNSEIEFFKVIKPQILSTLIYQKEILNLVTNVPTSLKHSLKFYGNKVQKFVKLLKVDSKFYSYYRSCSNDQDVVFFTRKVKKNILETDFSLLVFDARVSTFYDTKIATILAYDKLIIYAEHQIAKIKIKIKLKKQFKKKLPTKSKLQWTRNKADLIELVYALYYANVLNDGQVELKDIAKEIGQIFNLEIKDNLYRVHTDIKRRKNPKLNFIQNIADNYKKKLEEEN